MKLILISTLLFIGFMPPACATMPTSAHIQPGEIDGSLYKWIRIAQPEFERMTLEDLDLYKIVVGESDKQISILYINLSNDRGAGTYIPASQRVRLLSELIN